MKACVLDVSLALSWLFEDEATPETWALWNRISATGAVIPDIWFYELANVLTLALRRRRTTAQKVDAFLGELGTIDLRRDPAAKPAEIHILLEIAAAHRLSAYDAAYLELALRTGLPLATLDRALAEAARRAAVAVLPEA